MISINHAGKRYGKHEVLSDVSVAIMPGTLTTLIGSNGAGKSTLLSLAGRLLDGEGEFILEGRNIASFKGSELAKQLAMLRQSNHLTVRLTVAELVGFGRFPYSRTRLNAQDKQIVKQALQDMDLVHLANKYLDELSGGERQRAAIAMVIAQDTKYLLLDEPLNNLDMPHSVQIMKLLRCLVDARGKTVILVLHDINFASCYSDSIIAMRHGKLVLHAPTNNVITTEKLQEIYGMHIPVSEYEGRRYCHYHH